MATQADPSSLPTLDQLRSDRRSLGVGFLWGALLFVFLTIWLGARELEFPLLIYFLWAWTGLTLAIGIWQLWPIKAADAEAGMLRQTLVNQRKEMGLVLFGYTLVLLVLGGWLTSYRGLTSFGEVSSMVLLALIAGVAGLYLRGGLAGKFDQEAILLWLIGKRPAIMMVLLIGGVALMLLGLVLFLVGGLSQWQENFPQAGGCVLLGLVFAGSGLWALLTNQTDMTAQQMRILVLVVGGLSGLVITLMTALRIYNWWTGVFAAGLLVWQGESSWRLWICIYIELLGLAIMFASLLIVRVDIHANVVLRRLLYGYNSVVTGVLVLAILVVFNVLAYAAFPLTFEWTRTRGLYSLSSSSKNILENLKDEKKPVRVYVLLGEGSIFFRDVHVLLDNCQAYAPLFDAVYISPDRDAGEYIKLVQKYPELKQEQQIDRSRFSPDDTRGLLVVYGPDTGEKQPHAFIPVSSLGDRKLDEQEGGRKMTLAFRGEQVLMEKVQMLSEKGKKPKVYFTQFNGELEIDDQTLRPKGDFRGGGGLRARLRKDNYDVHGLIWGMPRKQFKDNELFAFSKKDAKSPDEVPEDASLVVIAYPFALIEEFPPRPYPKNGLEALERYLSRGGKLMVINPTPFQADLKVFDSGLPELLKKYGVQCGMDFILNFKEKGNYKRNLEFSQPWLVIATPPATTTNQVAREFTNQQLELALPHTIRALPGGNFRAEVMLEVKQPANDIFWAETDPEAARNPFEFLAILGKDKVDSRRSTEPLPVAVGVTDMKPPQKPRLVVLGDSWNASSRYINRSGVYYDFIRSSMEWLAERPVSVIGIAPKESGEFRLKASEVKSPAQIVWLPLGLMLLLIVGTGAGVWVVRRR